MPIANRDFERIPSPSTFGRINIESITTRMVLLTAALFVADRVLFREGVYFSDTPASGITLDNYPPILGLCHFSWGLVQVKLELWRFLTWPFVHMSPIHLLINLAGLHFFGPVVEAHYGSRRFLAFYILCCGGVLFGYMAMLATKHLLANPWVPLYSTAGPVLGILVAAAHIAPNTKTLIYGTIPIRLRTLAITMLLVSVYAVFTYGSATMKQSGGDAVAFFSGSAAHLGGAAVGLILIRSPQWVRLFQWSPFRRPPPF